MKCMIQIFHKYACFHSGPFCNERTRITCGEYPSIVNTIISFIMESDWTDVSSGPRELASYAFQRNMFSLDQCTELRATFKNRIIQRQQNWFAKELHCLRQ